MGQQRLAMGLWTFVVAKSRTELIFRTLLTLRIKSIDLVNNVPDLS